MDYILSSINILLTVSNICLILMILLYGKKTSHDVDLKLQKMSSVHDTEMKFIRDFQITNFDQLNEKMDRLISVNERNQTMLSDKLERLDKDLNNLRLEMLSFESQIHRQQISIDDIKRHVGLPVDNG